MDDIDKNFIDALNAIVARDLMPVEPLPYANVALMQLDRRDTNIFDAMDRYSERYTIAPMRDLRFDLSFVLMPIVTISVDGLDLHPEPTARQRYDYDGTASEVPPEIEP